MKNPRAFPVTETAEQYAKNEGMTLLDYFAAKAIEGMALKLYTSDANYQTGAQDISRQAYKLAKVMLKEREKHIK